MKSKLTGTTKLEKAVATWANVQGRDYEDGAKGALRDLFQGGCASGIVGKLIYYTDTVKFYNLHSKEIDGLLSEAIDDSPILSMSDVFGDRWDTSDPLAHGVINQNLLAWFGFEETARRLSDAAGFDL